MHETDLNKNVAEHANHMELNREFQTSCIQPWKNKCSASYPVTVELDKKENKALNLRRCNSKTEQQPRE